MMIKLLNNAIYFRQRKIKFFFNSEISKHSRIVVDRRPMISKPEKETRKQAPRVGKLLGLEIYS